MCTSPRLHRARAGRLLPPAAAVLFALLAPAAADTVSGPAKPVNGIRPADLRAHALVGGRVVVAPGRAIDDAVILIRDGMIEAVGQGLDVPADARVWDLKDLTVYPGLIDAAVLVDAGTLPESPGRHYNAKIHPELRVADRPLPDGNLRKQLRELGFTAAALYPREGILRGSGAVIALAEKPEHVLVYRDRAAMGMAFERAGDFGSPATPGSLMGAIALVRQALLDAHWYGEARAVYERHPEGNEPPAPADALAALAPVIAGRQPVVFDAADELNVLRAARVAREFGLDLQVLGSGLEFRRLGEVVATGAPIIVPLKFPERPEVSSLARAEHVTLREMMTWEQAPTNPRRLLAAGATVALTTQRLDRRGDFPAALHKAIRAGLSPDDALAALTVTPARLLGLEAVMGTIEPGKVANLVVVEGELFAKKPKIWDTWIDGRRSEIDHGPEVTLVLAGTLVTGDGRRVEIELDTTDRPSATFVLPGDRRVKARRVMVQEDRITMVVDGEAFGEHGYVRLGGAITDGTLTGTGALPDGRRFDFSITPRAAPGEKAADAGAGPEDAAAAAGDVISGSWITIVSGGTRPVEFTFDLVMDEKGRISGTASVGDFDLDLRESSWDPDAQHLHLEVGTPRGGRRSFEGTVTGDRITGTTVGMRGEGTFEGRRSGEEEDRTLAEMPPETLVTPLGAYGLPAPPARQDVLITDATIWTEGPAGVIEHGSLLVRDGHIAAVGPDVGAVEEGSVLRIDGRGRHVTPGLIDCHSHTGISGGVNEYPEADTAEVRIGDVINPDDISFYRQLAGGLTAANQLHGSANPIGGQNSVIKLRWGGAVEDFPVPGAMPGIKFALGENVKRRKDRYPNTRMGVETFIRDAFTAARAYQDKWTRYRALSEEKRQATIPPRRDLELEALEEVLEGRRLVHCHSYRQDEILALIRVADDFGFTIGTFQHVLEGYKVAEAIAAHGAGASTFSDWWAYKVEVMDAIPYNGSLMSEVGVVVSFNSDSSELARRLNTEAAKAVRYGGLEPAEALKFVTINPARQLRIDHRTGSLETGKDADFVIWSDSPLSTYARCEQTWIEGARYFDLDADRALRETIAAERRRLVQKILTEANGPPQGEPESGGVAAGGKAEPSAGPSAALPEEARAWIDRRLRAGEDPFENHPGDCGIGPLEQILERDH